MLEKVDSINTTVCSLQSSLKKMKIIFSAFLFCVKVGDFGCADGPGSAGPHHLHQNLQFEKKETKSPTNRGERGG